MRANQSFMSELRAKRDKARMVADAAPDLLAALQACVAELEAYEQDREQRDLCELARAAIAKAEGK